MPEIEGHKIAEDIVILVILGCASHLVSVVYNPYTTHAV